MWPRFLLEFYWIGWWGTGQDGANKGVSGVENVREEVEIVEYKREVSLLCR
jgi:hypothetical protein